MQILRTTFIVLAIFLASRPAGAVADQHVASSSATAHTGLTPAELGRRFLALLEHTESFSQLTAASVQRAMGVPFNADPDGGGSYTLVMPDGDWQYSVVYNFDEAHPQYSNIAVDLIRSRETAKENNAPCELELRQYQASLAAMGFAAEPPAYNHFGRIVAFNYTRKNLRVQIIPHHLPSAPNRPERDCVRTLSAHAFGPSQANPMDAT